MAKIETQIDFNSNESDRDDKKLEKFQNAVKYLFDKRDKLSELSKDPVEKDAFDYLKHVELRFREDR